MKKLNNSYIKQLRKLYESDMSEAEVIMASKAFSQDLQDMIEKIGRLMNEDLGPVVDQMREVFGNEQSENFNGLAQEQLQSVMTTLKDTKGNLDEAIENLASSGTMGNDMSPVDTSAELGDELGDEIDSELGDELGDEIDSEPQAPEMDMDIERELKS